MKKALKKIQGLPNNKLIITWKDYSPSVIGTERESLRCTSVESAQKIINKRTQNRMFFAKFYNNKGAETLFNLNTKDTILSI